MRILVTVSPRMYRQAIAFSIEERFPGHEVRTASPQAAAKEVAHFRPHLLVRNDTDGLGQNDLDDVPFWVEVRYSDSMNARFCAAGELSEAHDMSIEEFLGVVEEAVARTD